MAARLIESSTNLSAAANADPELVAEAARVHGVEVQPAAGGGAAERRPYERRRHGARERRSWSSACARRELGRHDVRERRSSASARRVRGREPERMRRRDRRSSASSRRVRGGELVRRVLHVRRRARGGVVVPRRRPVRGRQQRDEGAVVGCAVPVEHSGPAVAAAAAALGHRRRCPCLHG